MSRVADWWDDLRIRGDDHFAICVLAIVAIVAAVCAGLLLNAARPYADRVNAACASHRGVQDTSYWTSSALCRDGQMVEVPDR